MGYVPPRRPNPDIPIEWYDYPPKYPPVCPRPIFPSDWPPKPKPEPFRYPKDKQKPTTLIIGFRCKEGVFLVSDRKITDMENQEPIWASKLVKPLVDPFIFGAAGYVNLFREFNRKIFPQLQQSVTEYYVKNLRALIDSGLTREEAMAELADPSRVNRASRFELPTPYIYNADCFLDDCKKIIRGITQQYTYDSLQVLAGIGRGRDNPTLHQIDALGKEAEHEEYAAIGTGSPFVRMFFHRHYKNTDSMEKLTKLAFLTIRFTEKVALEASVGYTDEYPPEVFGVFRDGKCGKVEIKKMPALLKSIDEQIASFDKNIENAEKNIRDLSF
jgi:20S proteasome alpha/beta subunit